MIHWLAACAPEPVPSDRPEPTPPVVEEPFGLSGYTSRLHATFPTLVYAGWTQVGTDTVRVEYATDEGWRSAPASERGPGAHEQVLLGLPYDTVVRWRLVGEGSGVTSAEQVAVTGSGAGVPVATVATSDPARVDPTEFFLVGLAQGNAYRDEWWTLIVDRAGRPVWALPSPAGRTSRQARIGRDGRSLYLDRSSFFPLLDQGAQSTIEELTLEGDVLHTFAAPGLHHPFVDLPGGDVAYGRSIDWSQGSYVDEALTVVHRDGSTEDLWSCAAFLASIGWVDGCMSNTLNYDPASDTFLFSFFTSETVFEIGGDGSTARWFGHVPGAWTFDPPESAFWWQHGAHYTDAGTLLLSSDDAADATETVVREYALDDGVLREVWSFGVGQGVYGWQMGEAVRLPSGTTLHNYGRQARLREVTPEGEVVWDLTWASTGVGHSLPVPDLYALVR
ncbi:MAG: hypothetical protein ABMA64_12900 [Myxococcota bacterium]